MSSYHREHNVSESPAPDSETHSNSNVEALRNFLHNHNNTRAASTISELNIEQLRETIFQLASLDNGGIPGEFDPNKGVPESFFDSLERIDKKNLKEDDTCAICTSNFLSDDYPLVVKLQCSHRFDLECIRPWLLANTKCPLCRVDVLQKKQIELLEDSEEEFDDMYG